MSKRIFKGIAGVAIGVLTACLMIIMSILYSYFSTRSWEELQNEAQFIGAGVQQGGAAYLQSLGSFDTVRVTWVDDQGTVLFDSASPASAMENHLHREEIQQALQTGEGHSERYSTTLSEKTIYYAVQLPGRTVLRVSSTQSSAISLLLGMSQPIIIMITLVVLISMFLAYRISRKIVQPINEMNLEKLSDNQTYPELQPLLERLQRQYILIQQEVEDKEKLRREFSANVSHELKTPLTSISGTAEIMQSGLVSPEDIPHFAGNIYKESKRLITLVEDILKISQLDENQVSLNREAVNLAEIARQEADRLQTAAKNRGIQIELDLPGPDGRQPMVKGAAQILGEMVYNLLDNAIKYNKEGGHVWLSIHWAGDHVQLSVRDTGIGISPEDQPRVFERFYRVDKSHSKAIGGTGLGLSIVKHGALYHGAQIQLQSEVGKGTEITLRF